MSTRIKIDHKGLRAATEAMARFTSYDTPNTLAEDCIRAYLEAALSTEPGEAEGWKPIEAWAVFYDGRLTTLTDRLEVAEAYRRTGILEVRQVAAAPLPEESHHGR